jgi:hypothetical protein
VTDNPLLIFVVSLASLSLSVYAGVFLRRLARMPDERIRADFGVVQAATLTLLGLIIGFSFSMAVARYDQRKSYEEEEANAIGTEIVRADLLAPADAERVRALLLAYLEQRIAFFTASGDEQLRDIAAQTAKLQAELWSAVREPARAQPTPIVALVVSGMNDVLNAQGYTQAAWWNRIPIEAWGLMLAIAACANALVGFGARSARAERSLLLVIPVVVSFAFFLIADIESPRGGLIRVAPQNLLSLQQSLQRP